MAARKARRRCGGGSWCHRFGALPEEVETQLAHASTVEPVECGVAHSPPGMQSRLGLVFKARLTQLILMRHTCAVSYDKRRKTSQDPARLAP